MNRRDFLKSTAAVSGGALTGLAGTAAAQTQSPSPAIEGKQPNIVFILVDELRYPTNFPGDITTPGDFLKNYMPNLYQHVWQKGVKFGNYHTAANACTPSRGVMITGLYSQQNWLCTTILATPYPPDSSTPQPVLNPFFPTYGKLLRTAGYQTPYVGKWHVSAPADSNNALENYGFDYYESYYDPTGDNLQGTYGDESRGYHNDEYIATKAIKWLRKESPTVTKPWCLTVSLINPHDREFFPAGTEFKTYNDLFGNDDVNPHKLIQASKYPGNGPVVPWEKNQLKSPNSYGYSAVPPNWEDTDSIKNNKPKTQRFIKELQQAVWGGITDDPTQDFATIERYPSPRPLLNYGVAKMPYSYWARGMDSYTQVMGIVDDQIGRVLAELESLPADVRENTVIVFAADHGEYSGAHGLVQGKLGTVYEEAWHIPLIVVDPTNRLTGDIGTIRTGLASSVDLMAMLVSIGNNGSRDWMTPELAEIYGNRHDMIAMLKSASAPGRPWVLYATDEVIPNYFNFNKAPTHVLGYRTDTTKLGVYSKWVPLTSKMVERSIELEFYDHTTPNGKLELANTADSDPRVSVMVAELLGDLLPNHMQQTLPGALGAAQSASKHAHLLFRELVALKPAKVWQDGGLQSLLGYGEMF